jgi:hypothetical protein
MVLGLMKPDEPTARSGFLAFLFSAVGFVASALGVFRPAFGEWEDAIHFAFSTSVLLQFPLIYQFYKGFPNGSPKSPLWSVLTYLFYAFAIVMVVPNTLLLRVIARPTPQSIAFLSEHGNLLQTFAIAVDLFVLVSLVSSYAVLIRNYYAVEESDERRRIRWVVYGTAASVLPYGCVQAFGFAALALGIPEPVSSHVYFVLIAFATAGFVLIPLTLGYAILRHRVFDIRVAIRLGVQRIFARGVLEALLALPIVGLVYSIATKPSLTVLELLFLNSVYVYLIVGVALSLKFRSRLRQWVDQLFFRTAYDREQVVLDLIEEIKQHDSMADLSRRVSSKLEAALHPKHLFILYRQGDAPGLAVQYASGERSAELDLPADAKLFRCVYGEVSAQDVPLRGADLPAEEQEVLDLFAIALVVPMPATDRRLMGLLLLGEKRSEEPYSPRDRSLLESVAAQMAIVVENAQLKDHVARDRRIRVEVLGRVEHGEIRLLRECPACGTCYDSSSEVCDHDGAELTLTLPVERTIDGKYRLDRLIGKGGMGAVYEGTDLRLARRVALKVMTGRMFGDSAALRRFEREAQASARLSHPNIITVYDYGAIGDSGAFLVMELLRGQPLRTTMRTAGAIHPEVAAELFTQTLDGVKAAHHAGVIHRDLKPENVFIARSDEVGTVVKVLDFGLAKLKSVNAVDPSSLTAPGTIMGTFGYMSPEQLVGDDVDERSDVFALGVMAVEALTGEKPFTGNTWGELSLAIARGAFHIPGITAEARHLEAVLKRCVAASPKDRFDSVGAMQDALIPALLRYHPFGDAVARGPFGDRDFDTTKLNREGD